MGGPNGHRFNHRQRRTAIPIAPLLWPWIRVISAGDHTTGANPTDAGKPVDLFTFIAGVGNYPIGTATFWVNGVPFGSAPTVRTFSPGGGGPPTASATLHSIFLPSGLNLIQVSYSGDQIFYPLVGPNDVQGGPQYFMGITGSTVCVQRHRTNRVVGVPAPMLSVTSKRRYVPAPAAPLNPKVSIIPLLFGGGMI